MRYYFFQREVSHMAHATPPSGEANENPTADSDSDRAAWDVELLRVFVSRNGTRVDARWMMHPQLKHDLTPREWGEVTDLMAQVADIIGHRFSQILAESEPTPPGHA
jgi:hypothetical protein